MFMDSLVNRPYRTLEQQKAFQASHAPIYLRPPHAKAYLGAYFAVFTVGMVGTAYGIYALAFTQPMKKDE